MRGLAIWRQLTYFWPASGLATIISLPIEKFLFRSDRISDFARSPSAQEGLPIPDVIQTVVEGLEYESDSGIGFFSQNLECSEELSGLTGEETIGSEACDRGHGACKFIG
jgi:hypothetical protein